MKRFLELYGQFWTWVFVIGFWVTLIAIAVAIVTGLGES